MEKMAEEIDGIYRMNRIFCLFTLEIPSLFRLGRPPGGPRLVVAGPHRGKLGRDGPRPTSESS